MVPRSLWITTETSAPVASSFMSVANTSTAIIISTTPPGWRRLSFHYVAIFVNHLENARCGVEPQFALCFWPDFARLRQFSQQTLHKRVQSGRLVPAGPGATLPLL